MGGEVTIDIEDPTSAITVDMGSVRFADEAQLNINGNDYLCHIADIGNPHCVIPLDSISPELTHKDGPVLETHLHFPNRTNVQFLKVIDRNNIQIEIWERGAGYTKRVLVAALLLQWLYQAIMMNKLLFICLVV